VLVVVCDSCMCYFGGHAHTPHRHLFFISHTPLLLYDYRNSYMYRTLPYSWYRYRGKRPSASCVHGLAPASRPLISCRTRRSHVVLFPLCDLCVAVLCFFLIFHIRDARFQRTGRVNEHLAPRSPPPRSCHVPSCLPRHHTRYSRTPGMFVLRGIPNFLFDKA
jgi:hypothetical protein